MPIPNFTPNYQNPSQFRLPTSVATSGYTFPVAQEDPNMGSGLPNDLMSQIKTLMAQFGGRSGSASPAPMMTSSTQPGMGQQYLQQIQALMKQLSGGGLPALSPEMQAEFAQRKADMSKEINTRSALNIGRSNADLYARGMENSGQSRNTSDLLEAEKARAYSSMLTGLFGEEMGLRNQMGQNQTQGVLGQIQVLRDLMNAEEQKNMMAQQNQQQNFQNSQVLAQNDEQRKMQMMEMIMQLVQRFGNVGGGGAPKPLVTGTQFVR